ncbi:NADP-dependent 3-hydroxy acid dehydrogenase YdfG [Chitinophaga niastensis]|uniref:NADP-dependent 3-hydroxy acid dehydrogenase YdfG n=1 Tax=Chitinophaga niastensis TaxID=536980 RepID=A0A2P8HEH7_CHINA|nr:SDR family oxidoreductase [Chitinophaga niastensis]PSL44632.1 NADP-dependent 3-hydroxy acid dehydrogenase YdfG [Chitinophaga niastensis]
MHQSKKVVLITGASSGLGLAVASYLWTNGYIVYGASRSIQGDKYPFHTLQMDVAQEASIETAVGAIIQEQGHIDVLINNAGLGLIGPSEYLSLSDVAKVMDVNVLGALRSIQAVLPQMRSQKSGLIINISSIASENGLPYRAAYSASKASLDRITEALRAELASFGVQACYIQPGGFNTEINDNRMVTLLKGDAYKGSWERCHRIIKDSVSLGLSPAMLGPAVEKIIESKRVKRCYRIGKPLEKLSVVLKKLLPDHIYDKMIRKHFEIY